MNYCAHCRDTIQNPWQHAENCPEGLWATVRTLKVVVPALLLVSLVELYLLLGAWGMVELCQ